MHAVERVGHPVKVPEPSVERGLVPERFVNPGPIHAWFDDEVKRSQVTIRHFSHDCYEATRRTKTGLTGKKESLSQSLSLSYLVLSSGAAG